MICKRLAGFVLIVLVLIIAVACSREQPAEPEPAEIDESPRAPAIEEPASGAVPPDQEASPPAGTESVTGLHGFGPARFGDDAESVRIAWGRPLVFAPEPSLDRPCGYLVPEPTPSDPLRIRFMFDGDRFVRYDVLGEQYEAPGSARIGNTLDALEALYADRHTVSPHKYIEGGHYFEVAAGTGNEALLVFELDAADTVIGWRVGLPPAIHYVEGCS